MPSLGNLFTAIGRMLPGFYEGERQAIQDNWQDLENYNNVRKGQLDNLWTEATWSPALYNAWLTAPSNTLDLYNKMRIFRENLAAHQGNMDVANIYAANAGAAARNIYNQGGTYAPQGASGQLTPNLPYMGGANNAPYWDPSVHPTQYPPYTQNPAQ